jgi:hypothetical protein
VLENTMLKCLGIEMRNWEDAIEEYITAISGVNK